MAVVALIPTGKMEHAALPPALNEALSGSRLRCVAAGDAP